MGLDVYLKRCENLEHELSLQNEAERISDELWAATGKSYEQLTDVEKEATRLEIKSIYTRLGLDECGSSKGIETIEQDSALYPEHMFKVGYLRSSYNSGGINSVLERAGVPTLYNIFQPSKEEYYVTPDWEACLNRVEAATEGYKAHFADPMGAFDVMSIRSPIFEGIESPIEALALFKTQMEKYQTQKATQSDAWSSFSNREGEFFLEGRKVFGFIPNSGWGKGFHVIVDKERSETVDGDWYYQALLVTKETIEYVLSRPVEDQKNFFLSWSG